MQISHHPPVSAYQLEGPGWQMNGWSQPAVVPVVKFYGIKTMAKGSRSLHFDADDSNIEMTMPSFAIKGEGLLAARCRGNSGHSKMCVEGCQLQRLALAAG